jgi:hypothetical protein
VQRDHLKIASNEKLWTVPAGKEHRVPLSAAALAVLRRAREAQQGDE